MLSSIILYGRSYRMSVINILIDGGRSGIIIYVAGCYDHFDDEVFWILSPIIVTAQREVFASFTCRSDI